MLSATADTNIYISAFNFGGSPRDFLRLAGAGGFRLAISDPILVEIGKVLFFFLGDKHLLRLVKFEGMPIVKVVEFLDGARRE